jgi:uridine kinase
VEERGRDLQGIVDQYLTTVKPMHYIYVEPTRAMADVVLNSGMNDVAFDVVSAKIRSILAQSKLSEQ